MTPRRRRSRHGTISNAAIAAELRVYQDGGKPKLEVERGIRQRSAEATQSSANVGFKGSLAGRGKGDRHNNLWRLRLRNSTRSRRKWKKIPPMNCTYWPRT